MIGRLGGALVLALALAGSALAQPGTPGDAAAGEDDFQAQCGICHVSEGGGQGPSLVGVYGRKSGTASGFSYSEAMKGAGITWTETSLDPYLANPQKAVPGSAMPFAVADAKTRADVIAYLKTLK